MAHPRKHPKAADSLALLHFGPKGRVKGRWIYIKVSQTSKSRFTTPHRKLVRLLAEAALDDLGREKLRPREGPQLKRHRLLPRVARGLEKVRSDTR